MQKLLLNVGSQKMGQIMTKKRYALDGESLNMLMRISQARAIKKS